MKKNSKKVTKKKTIKKTMKKPVSKSRVQIHRPPAKKPGRPATKAVVIPAPVVVPVPPEPPKPVVLNVPSTAEQQAGIPAVINGDSFEGVKRIDHLPLEEQIDTVFNPLHTITKTTIKDAASESTFIVEPVKRNT
jgi:hypothetical protein